MVRWVVNYVTFLMNADDTFDFKGLDITNKQEVDTKFDTLKPEVVYHCTVYIGLIMPRMKGNRLTERSARMVRAMLPRQPSGSMLRWSTSAQITSSMEPILTSTRSMIQNEYGKAKLAGEQAVKEALDDYYIIRTSWVFGKYGKNFVYTMVTFGQDT